MATAETRKHILVLALGSSGDVNPMLGLALSLKRRGHGVLLAANPVFGRFARAGDLAFHPIGTEEDYDFVWDPATWRWWSCARAAFTRGWRPYVRPIYDCLRTSARSESPEPCHGRASDPGVSRPFSRASWSPPRWRSAAVTGDPALRSPRMLSGRPAG